MWITVKKFFHFHRLILILLRGFDKFRDHKEVLHSPLVRLLICLLQFQFLQCGAFAASSISFVLYLVYRTVYLLLQYVLRLLLYFLIFCFFFIYLLFFYYSIILYIYLYFLLIDLKLSIFFFNMIFRIKKKMISKI